MPNTKTTTEPRPPQNLRVPAADVGEVPALVALQLQAEGRAGYRFSVDSEATGSTSRRRRTRRRSRTTGARRSVLARSGGARNSVADAAATTTPDGRSRWPRSCDTLRAAREAGAAERPQRACTRLAAFARGARRHARAKPLGAITEDKIEVFFARSAPKATRGDHAQQVRAAVTRRCSGGRRRRATSAQPDRGLRDDQAREAREAESTTGAGRAEREGQIEREGEERRLLAVAGPAPAAAHHRARLKTGCAAANCSRSSGAT